MTKFKPLKGLFLGLAVTGASVAALAQTTTTAPMGTSQTPAAVGVSPQTAAEANRQAVPRSDTATVVRTGPDAVDSARTAASAAERSAPTMGTGNASVSGTTMRPAKADRN